MSAVLDTGALIALDRGDRATAALLRTLHDEGVPLRTSAGAVAQVWRRGERQARLAAFLRGVEVVSLDDTAARTVGTLLAHSRTTDVIDAHVALLADPTGHLLTSDPGNLRALLKTRRVAATVVPV